MAGEQPAACESTNNFFIVNNMKTSQDHGFCEVFLTGNARWDIAKCCDFDYNVHTSPRKSLGIGES